MRPGADAVLSIQSQVCSGHVGNSAATLPLQRLGFDVLAIPTVLLAHHPGHGRWRGHKLRPEQAEELLAGLEERGALGRCAGLLSGYLGDVAMADVVVRAQRGLRSARPDALYLCDPVIGDDDTGVFVATGIPEAIRERLLPLADVVTPNRFELAHLTGRPVETLSQALLAAAALRALGPGIVVATGLTFPDARGELAVLADATAGAWRVVTPRLGGVPHGAGDVFSALFLGHYLRTRAVPQALERATAGMLALSLRTVEAGADELSLVAGQNEFLRPRHLLRAERLRGGDS